MLCLIMNVRMLSLIYLKILLHVFNFYLLDIEIENEEIEKSNLLNHKFTKYLKEGMQYFT
jgi:hypothetical protein